MTGQSQVSSSNISWTHELNRRPHRVDPSLFHLLLGHEDFVRSFQLININYIPASGFCIFEKSPSLRTENRFLLAQIRTTWLKYSCVWSCQYFFKKVMALHLAQQQRKHCGQHNLERYNNPLKPEERWMTQLPRKNGRRNETAVQGSAFYRSAKEDGLAGCVSCYHAQRMTLHVPAFSAYGNGERRRPGVEIHFKSFRNGGAKRSIQKAYKTRLRLLSA